ncbi:MAG TPA: TetR/AcrR family transcriptional regulator [Propionibacteriaceae bacterium]
MNGSPETPDTHGYAKGIARRAAIVAVATEFFGRVGYRGATMLQIAAACGISRAGLLHHFPTKESLLEAVLTDRDRANRVRLPADHDGPDDGLVALRKLVEVVQLNSTVPAIINLYSVLSAEAGDPAHPAHDHFVRRYVASRADIQGSLEHARRHGHLAEGVDPATTAIELIALMDGLQVQWLLAPDVVDMAGVLRRRIELALTVPLDRG